MELFSPKYAAGVLAFCSSTKRFLICQRGPKISNPNKWAHLGGKCSIGETPAITAVREFYEESGCYVPISLKHCYVSKKSDGFCYYHYLGVVQTEFIPLVGKTTVDGEVEIQNYKWVTFDELYDFKKENLHWGFAKYINSAKKILQQISK